MNKLVFSPIVVENIGSNIIVLGRRKDKTRMTELVHFSPYFYIPYQGGDKRVYKSITGELLERVYVDDPKRVPQERSKYEKHYEADIIYTNRFLIDNFYDKEIDEVPIRIMYLDIEVDDSVGYEKVFSYQSKIIAITFYDSFLKTYFTLVVDNKTGKIQNKNHIILKYSDEKSLLSNFIAFVKELDPDILTGWNVNFDMIYILKRIEFYFGREYIKELSPKSLERFNAKYAYYKISDKQNKSFVKIRGRIVLDLMEAYKFISNKRLQSYALDFVCNYELGIGKTKEKKKKISNMNLNELITYNKRDVELLVKLNNKLSIIEFLDNIRRLARINFSDIFSVKRIIDSLSLVFAKKEGIILPSQPENAKHEKFEGAYVKQPPKGKHNWVVGLDFKSLYPSIIRQFNMSYETFLESKQPNCINIDDKFFFKKEPQGFIPKIIDFLFEQRKKNKKLMKQATNDAEYKKYYLRQWAYKIMMNAFYGVLTTPYFRLFNIKIGEAITYMGRRFIKFAEEYWEKNNYEVVIVDTDSTYIKLNVLSLEEAIEKGKQLYKEINSLWDEFLTQFNAQPNKYMEMEFEKVYHPLLTFGVKKRYVGLIVYKDDKILEPPEMDVKGMHIVRSDFPVFAQRFLEETIYKILLGFSKNQIIEFIEKFKQDFKKASLDEIGFPYALKPSHMYKVKTLQVRAMENSQKYLGLPYKEGKVLVFFVKKTPDGIPYNDVWVFDEETEIPKGFEIDWAKTFNKIIYSPLKDIFDVLGWNLFEEALLFERLGINVNVDNRKIYEYRYRKKYWG